MDTMKCIICGGAMAYYFSKTFDSFGLGKVDYWRCGDCGFSISRTHAEMTAGEWTALNQAYHSAYLGSELNPDDPRWIARLQCQAQVLADAAQLGLLNGAGRWLDYACGDGKLSELLEGEGRTLLKYDRYMGGRDNYLDDAALRPGSFDFLITTSVFEHLTLREHFDSIEKLVSARGVLGLHTLVREEIPCDPSWFYLLPVHCAFHTNRSVSHLLQQWGYSCSLYNVDARLWLCFRQDPADVRERLDRADRRPDGPKYIFADGFVDYWK